MERNEAAVREAAASAPAGLDGVTRALRGRPIPDGGGPIPTRAELDED